MGAYSSLGVPRVDVGKPLVLRLPAGFCRTRWNFAPIPGITHRRPRHPWPVAVSVANTRRRQARIVGNRPTTFVQRRPSLKTVPASLSYPYPDGVPRAAASAPGTSPSRLAGRPKRLAISPGSAPTTTWPPARPLRAFRRGLSCGSPLGGSSASPGAAWPARSGAYVPYNAAESPGVELPDRVAEPRLNIY